MRSVPTLVIAIILSSLAGDSFAQPAIGRWRDHFQYKHTIAVVQGNDDVYCATTTALFKYNEQSAEMERYSKVNALSDVNIQSLGWNSQLNTLIVGYKNGNIDLISQGNAMNMSDIKRSSMIGDKGIYCVVNRGSLVYLGCGFGIVVVDLVRKEVNDTWLIGPNAAQLRINGIAFLGDSIYAATNAGLYAAWTEEANLAAFTSWHKRTDIPGANGNFSAVVSFNAKLMVNRRVSDVETQELDTVYYFDNGWQVMTSAVHDFNRSFRVSPDGSSLVITGRQIVKQYNTDLQEVNYAFDLAGASLLPKDAILRGQDGFWIATDGNGLVKFINSNNFTVNCPNGPSNNSTYRMSCEKSALYVTTGGPSGNWGNQYRKDGVHYFVDGVWNTTDRSNDPLYDSGGNEYAGSLNDAMAVQVDPQDGTHVFVGSWDDGLVEMRNGHVTGFYGANNSTLQRFQNGTSDDIPTQVGGIAYDEAGNLWVSNSNCIKPISVRLKNGNWYSMGTGSALGNNSLIADMIVAENGYKWIIRPRSAGLLVFTDNGTPTVPDDDQAKALNTFDRQGKLPSNDVFSIAEDKDHQIWVGTGKGVAVFYNPDAIFSNSGGFDAQQILIQQDGNWQLLLETEAVSAIAVDGANRKWLGTQSSGLYLVSADGTEQLAHFTAANSPLPSDNVTCLAIDGATGEVFIGTDQGIVSYRGEATEGNKTADCSTVFPNPVRETYTGPVAITGLVQGSDVRITDVAGNLVFHTTSLGGQAIWPATDMGGQRVGTGIYLVFSVDPDGTRKCNTKVAVIR
jgi:hypothetical protein